MDDNALEPGSAQRPNEPAMISELGRRQDEHEHRNGL